MKKRCLSLEDIETDVLILQKQIENVDANIELINHYYVKDSLFYLQSPENRLPDFMLLDIKLPDGDAFEVLDFLKSKNLGNIPVFIITSSIFTECKEKALTYTNVVDYYQKPFNRSVLENIKQHLLQHNFISADT